MGFFGEKKMLNGEIFDTKEQMNKMASSFRGQHKSPGQNGVVFLIIKIKFV